MEEATGMVTFSQYADGIPSNHPKEKKHVLWKSSDPKFRGVAAYAAEGGYEGNRTYPSSETPFQRMLVKTHWPKEYGGLESLNANLKHNPAICLHRFPLDAIASYIQFTNPYLSRIASTRLKRAEESMDDVTINISSLRAMARNWTRWHDFWLERNTKAKTISFEELVNAPNVVLKGVVVELNGGNLTDLHSGDTACRSGDEVYEKVSNLAAPICSDLDRIESAVSRAVKRFPPRRSAVMNSLNFFTKTEIFHIAEEIVDSRAVQELGYRQYLVDLMLR